MSLNIFLCFFSQKNVRKKRNGIKVPYKKPTSSMDILMSKDWKCAAYPNRVYELFYSLPPQNEDLFRCMLPEIYLHILKHLSFSS